MGCSGAKPQQGQPGLNVQDAQSVRSTIEAKIVLLGDSGVGKSSLALRFCQGRFNPYHEVTIGAAFLQQIVRLRDGSQLKLHVWDTGGQERFRAMTHLYYRDAAGAVIVYDCTDAHSQASVDYWVQELQNKAGLPELPLLAGLRLPTLGLVWYQSLAPELSRFSKQLFKSLDWSSPDEICQGPARCCMAVAANKLLP
ncbi:unnamed protein product [Effrenium voratum]|nr:unnamed protein product [Effrenium voratum]